MLNTGLKGLHGCAPPIGWMTHTHGAECVAPVHDEHITDGNWQLRGACLLIHSMY